MTRSKRAQQHNQSSNEEKYLFCLCEGPKGQTGPEIRRIANRHAQLHGDVLNIDGSDKCAPQLPGRWQLRFKLPSNQKFRCSNPQPDLISDIGPPTSSPATQSQLRETGHSVHCSRCSTTRQKAAAEQCIHPKSSSCGTTAIIHKLESGCLPMSLHAGVYRAGLAYVWSSSMSPSQEQNSPEVQSHISNWLPARSKAHAAVNDALSILELSQVAVDNPSVATAGAATYLKAIHGMRLTLANVTSHTDVFNLKVLGHILLLGEMYQAVVPASSPRQWEHHIRGLLSMEAIYGRSVRDDFSQVVFRHLRIESLMGGLILREDMTSGKLTGLPRQRRPIPQKLQKLEALLDIGLLLPRLLHDTDQQCVQDPASSSEAAWEETYRSALRFDTALTSWYRDNYSIERSSSTWPYAMVPVSKLDCKPPLPGDCPPTFSVSYVFDTFLESFYHSFYWIMLLLVRESVLHLEAHSSRRNFSSKTRSRGPVELDSTSHHEALAEWCANNLCRTVPYMLSYADGLTGKALAVGAPLHFAQQFFQRANGQSGSLACRAKKLKWCDSMIAAVKSVAPMLNWEPVVLWHVWALVWYNPAA